MFSSIRADQDPKIFVDGLHKNKEPLLSLARSLMFNRGDTQEERRTYLSTGIYLDAVLKMHFFDIDPFSNNPAVDYPVEDSSEPQTAAERREIIAFQATQIVASKWLDNHSDSEAAREVARFGIYAAPWHQGELLQEMWTSLRAVAMYSLSKK